VVVTIGGRLSDIFGRRWFLISGAIFGAAGAVVGATGQSISQMIAAGILMGIGGGFGEMIFASVQEIVPNQQRLFVLGCVEISNIPAMLSPMIGYAFISHAKLRWRVCYWWMFTFEAVTAICLFFFYKPPSFRTKHREDGKTKLQLVAALDYIGLFLFLAGCILLLLGLNWVCQTFMSTIGGANCAMPGRSKLPMEECWGDSSHCTRRYPLRRVRVLGGIWQPGIPNPST
jgi:MFS family permease